VLGGAGHVGLPLALAFADSGIRVGIFDLAVDKLDRLSKGELPFRESGAAELLERGRSSGRLEFSAHPEMIRRTSSVLVVVGTPIDEFLNPSFGVFSALIQQIGPHLRQGTLLVLRSTVFPGTTAFVGKELAERGTDVHTVFCPERIAEGYALEEFNTFPEIIGADSDAAADRAEALFQRIASKTIRTTTKEAELMKLFTNAWRYMKFAIANQFFMVAHTAGVDYDRVLRAIREDYPRAMDLPSPGFAAGPCLLKDTMQLAAFSAAHIPLGHSAMQINEGLPGFVVSAMEQRFGSLRGRSVGILGMAFKAESDDTRASLSYKLRRLLMWSGADVLCTDPYVRDDGRLVPLERVLAESEVLVIGVPHRIYRGLKLPADRLVDIWGTSGRIAL